MSAEEASRIARAVQRVRSSKRALQIALPTAAALGAGAAVAVGSVVGGDGTITGCYAGQNGAVLTVNGDGTVTEPAGALRVIDPTLTISGTPGAAAPDPLASQCEPKQETQIAWNQKGPQGPPGAPGSQGATGESGLPGETTFGLSNAAGKTFLKIDGIKGESLDSKHKGDIEINSFQWGVGRGIAATGGGTGAGAGKTSIESFKITKSLDKSSPLLLSAEATGKHFKFAEVLFARKAGGKQQDYLYIKMDNAFISSVQDSSGSNGKPTESVSFNFQKVEMAYVNGDGRTQAKVNLNFGTSKAF